jgi:hypothetical protein
MVSVDVKGKAAKDNANAGINVVWTSPIRRASRGPCTRRALSGIYSVLQGSKL